MTWKVRVGSRERESVLQSGREGKGRGEGDEMCKSMSEKGDRKGYKKKRREQVKEEGEVTEMTEVHVANYERGHEGRKE